MLRNVPTTDSSRRAREAILEIGREVSLARANHGLTRRSAARLAGVVPSTQRRVEGGDPSVQLTTLMRVTSAVGLRLWIRVFPIAGPSLRDSGQLAVASWIRSVVPPTTSVQMESPIGNGRSIDVVLFTAAEILAIEVERMLVDFQAQYRSAVAKRDELAASHSRPVRLVMFVTDSHRNRHAVRGHEPMIRSALPAGTREVLAAMRHGRPVGRDGLAWVRHQRR
jgi:hypothetical protein